MCGDQGYVTIEVLAEQFPESYWHSLDIRTSPVCKLLHSEGFKVDKTGILSDSKRIDATHLKCFGLLHCKGDSKDKATNLFIILMQDKPNFDKNLSKIFEKMCALASWELFDTVQRVGSMSVDYSLGEIAQLRAQVTKLR